MELDFLQGLDERIEYGLKKLNVPGATVAITKGDKILYSKAFGYADLENKIKMETKHLLPIGSSSKSFTAASAVMLACEGKLDLDAPVRKYMPEFDLSDPIAAREATTRDLLCHRTGLPRHDLMWIGWDDLERKDLIENRIKHLTSSKPFRSTWQYQNHMFATVGYLIERISGKTWENFVAERIFEPLGITNFGFKVDYDSKTLEYAKLYEEDKDHALKETTPLDLGAIGPAGSINSTAEDVAKYVQMMLNKGKIGDKTLIDAKLFPELVKPNINYQLLPFEVKERIPVGYALGWFVDSYRGHRIVDHGGNVNGATALVSMMPDDDIGCVILTNADHSMYTMSLALEIYDRYLGVTDKKDWFEFYHNKYNDFIDEMKKSINLVLDSKVEGKPMSHELSEYVGTYTFPAYNDITVSLEGDSLYLKYNGRNLELSHLHYDIFTFMLMDMAFPVSFATGINGNIESLSVAFEGQVAPLVFVKK